MTHLPALAISSWLTLIVGEDGRLFQAACERKTAAFPTAGDGWVFEPALQVTHADGNTSTDLRVVTHKVEGDLTTIQLKDPAYPFFVDLFYRTYPEEDILEAWTEIRNAEPGVVTLYKFASSTLELGAGEFWLSQFHGDFSNEVNLSQEKLTFGKKTIESKLGVRANQFLAPWFLLSQGGLPKEDEGEVIGGSLAWSGSFSFEFEVGPENCLRSICGINPYASEYHLQPGEVFKTPPMIWAWSDKGAGQMSRNLHRWVRANALRDGDRTRAILLNNWEATYFAFDEKKIISLFDRAKAIGMELFLLDDGWFGSKFPRDDDSQGLGDWMPDTKKLPNGLGALTEAAAERGLRFGIWLEPEMVNPQSELFEKHPDWAIQQPKRPLDLQRNQLVLDLCRPEVKDFVFEVANRTLTENPGIAYVKWDCNRYLTQPGSTYLTADKQSHLWIEYVRGLYEVFDRLAKSHPNVEIMMCSGGGGRVDFGAMKFAHEYWPSDQTDPAKRVFIQWGYSHFLPAIATSAHVTSAGSHSLKFGFDVAMSGRLGMDLDLDSLNETDLAFAAQAIQTYKEIRDVIQFGELYRLESPYDGPRSALMYIHAVCSALFVYSLGDSPATPLRLSGLDQTKNYRIRELNLTAGRTGLDRIESGATLLHAGLDLPPFGPSQSAVFELTEV